MFGVGERDGPGQLRCHCHVPHRARLLRQRGGRHRRNIYQESGGNPESVGDGGGGLIGWTPLPGGYVTGNPAADLQTQLSAILTFNQIWAQYIPALNAAGSPAEAANIYVTDFERAGIPAYGTREAAAEAVAAACGI